MHKVNIKIQIVSVLKGRFNKTILQQYDCVKMGFGDMCVVNFGQTHQLQLCADSGTCPYLVCNTYSIICCNGIIQHYFGPCLYENILICIHFTAQYRKLGSVVCTFKLLRVLFPSL